MHFRSIFLSDTHLGSKGCNAEALLDFLHNHEADALYLVGDIIDFWQLKSKVFWPKSHNTVVQKVLRASRKGTKVYYIPGNHDENLREYDEMILGEIHLVKEMVHVRPNGDKFLVVHGDEFDGITRYAKWISHLGDWAYNCLLGLNRYFNWFRRHLGLGYWSLSAYLKHQVKDAVKFIGNFEHALAHHCKKQNFHGIISGHIHTADIRKIEGVVYINDGDWVESCTALVEHEDGTMQILKYIGPNNYEIIFELSIDGTIKSFA